jgi:hypothetical protein
MAFELFGFRVGKIEDEIKKDQQIPSFAPKPNEDGAIEFAPGGSYGTYVDLDSSIKNEADLITRYRSMSGQAEIERAIDDVINEAIVTDEINLPVKLNLDKLKQPERVKKRIFEEFDKILDMLDFGNMAYDIFRRWYIDGRVYYHMMIDEKRPRDGIKELRYVDPRRIRKMRVAMTKRPALNGAQPTAPVFQEYYIYNQNGITNTGTTTQGVKISADSICYVHSGILDERNKMVLSYLHKAIKPLNQLRMLEDATVIYRIARAPERRIFYIDVGNLPKLKAEQYLRDMMIKHKNRLVYDATTGEVRDDRKFMTMLEDYWLPRREGGRGTEITTLPGGQNLGELQDVEYFQKKLYQSLNVPSSRTQADNTFNMGRSSEISRDEIKFAKFITRIRARFSHLFDHILETQLVLTGVMSKAEWKNIKNSIVYDFLEDNYYSEIKEQEMVTQRLNILQVADVYVGKYYSKEWIRKNVLRQSEEEIKEIDKQNEVDELNNPPVEEMPIQPAAGGSAPPPQQQQQNQPPGGPAPQPRKLPSSKTEGLDFQCDLDIEPTEEELQLVKNMSKLMEKVNFESGDNIQDVS